VYPPVALPLGAPGLETAEVAASVDAWITSAPLRDLVGAFGGQWPTGDTPTTLAWLDDFSAEHWDFRGGRERPDAAEPVLEDGRAHLVVEAARALGMVDPAPPPRTSYEHVVVLGGLAHACLQRTGYAAHLVRSAVTTAGQIAALGSFRGLTGPEHDTLAAAGVPGCATEVDVLDAGVRRSFGIDTADDEIGVTEDHPHCSWSARTYRSGDGPPVLVLGAPSSDPVARRAHTADTQRFWAKHVRLSRGDRLLMVTASIYVPFQHCDAVRTLGLPYGCGIDTVGVDQRFVDPRLPPPTLTPGRYLQEIRSAIRSMRALHSSTDGGTAAAFPTTTDRPHD
jgi:hypothetical protein